MLCDMRVRVRVRVRVAWHLVGGVDRPRPAAGGGAVVLDEEGVASRDLSRRDLPRSPS